MNFHEFRLAWFDSVCFNTNQVYAWQPGFDKNNLGRWVKKGWLIKLCNGYHSFPEYQGKPDFSLFVANRIYRPSYISLHTALSFYGLIPELVVQITSVTSLKTATFTNSFGSFSYQTVKSDFFFGYESKPLTDGRFWMLAKPEKALVDLLYLYPFYKTPDDFRDLRLDGELMQELIHSDLLYEFARRFNNQTLVHRIDLLLTTYNL